MITVLYSTDGLILSKDSFIIIIIIVIIIIVILNYDWLKDNRKFFKPMISREMMTKILCGNFEKSFLEWEKMASRKIFPALPPREFFHVYIINK